MSGSTPNPYQFGGAWGYITDPSGMVQLGQRFYWPEIGRFIHQDPIGDGTNWYAYAGNNPLVEVDPEGLGFLGRIWNAIKGFFLFKQGDLPTYGDLNPGSGDLQNCRGAAGPAVFSQGSPRRVDHPVWPSTPEEMDNFLGVPGKRVPDKPGTPGRNQVVWKLGKHTMITYEQHPYHDKPPYKHQGPHWHLDIKEKGAPYKHAEFEPGDPIPGY